MISGDDDHRIGGNDDADGNHADGADDHDGDADISEVNKIR